MRTIRVESGVVPIDARQTLHDMGVRQTSGLRWSCPNAAVRERAMALMRRSGVRVKPGESLP